MISSANPQNPTESLGSVQTIASSDKNRSFTPSDWLAKVASLFGAQAGILWDATSGFRVIATLSQDDSPPTVKMRQEDHERMMADVLQNGKPVLLQTQYTDSDRADLLLVGKFDAGTVGLIELIIENHKLDQTGLGALERRFRDALHLITVSYAGPLGGLSAVADQRSAQDTPFDPQELSTFLKLIHSSIDLPLAAANIANESRRILDYDRVTVLVQRGGKQKVVAISGQASVNRRSNTTKLLEKFAISVLKTGQTFWFPDTDDLPTAIRTSLDDYVQVSQTRCLALLPIRKASDATNDPAAPPKLQPVIGGIVFERFQKTWERGREEPKVHFLASHAEQAIGNALQHQQIFLYPLWKLLGRTKVLTQPKYLNKTLVGFGLLVAVVLALCFWPVNFYVTADGMLIPSTNKPVFSNVKGEVRQVLVHHGDTVTTGQALVQMTSPEHEFRVEELQSQLKTARQRLTIVEDQRYSPTRDKSAEDIEENIVSLRTQIESLESQLAILNKITALLTVHSPIDGQVITWDLKHQLENRVVGEGVRLMEVADIAGQWMIEIDLPIRRQGHVARAIQNGDLNDLKVSFLLAADTSKRYSGRVVEISDVVSVSSDNRQVIKVRAAIDDRDITIDQVRSAVSAKVYCGKSTLGYLWFSDIGEFFQKHVFFPLF